MIVIFRIIPLDFAEMQKNVQNKKTYKTNLGPKMFYLGILGCKFEKVFAKLQNFVQN